MQAELKRAYNIKMSYIVFDLEWNQCPYGKQAENPLLPFEIIEIGAVRLNEARESTGSFHALVKPCVYRRLHYQTSRVIGLSEEDLQKGIPFTEAAEAFLEFCGEDPVFCTWGTLDLTEFQRNLRFYDMLDRLPGPILYEDVQKLFAIQFETRADRRSLSYAVEFLNLPEEEAYHLASADAEYTARVFRRISPVIAKKNYSVDCFQNPKTRDEELRLKYDTYEKFISREYEAREDVMNDAHVTAVHCFLCHRNVKRVIRFFADGGGRNYLAAGLCPDHGYVKCKVRVREAQSGKYYAIRTTKMISEEEMQRLRAKQVMLRVKKQNRRK